MFGSVLWTIGWGLVAPLLVASPTLKSTGFALSQWRLLGPLPVSVEADPFQADAAAFVGLNERMLVEQGMTTAVEGAKRGPHCGLVENFWRVEPDNPFLDFHYLYGLEPGGEDVKPLVAYAATTVKADTSRTAYLLIGSSNGARVWLNGEPIHDTPSARGVYTYDNVVPLKLREGANELLFRVCRTRSTWGLVARLEPTAESASAEALEAQGIWQALFFEQPVVQPGEAVVFQPRATPRGQPFDLQLRRLSGAVIDRQRVRAGERWLAPEDIDAGVYRLSTNVRGKDYWQWMLVGDPLDIAGRLRDRALRTSEAYLTPADRNALLGRIEILSAPEHRDFRSDSQRWRWDRKMIYVLAELEQAIERAKAGRSAYRLTPGLHVRGFVSSIDGAMQHYRIYVPGGGTDDRKIPLIVMLPTVVSANRPFLASAFMASHVESERIAYLAEKVGAAVVWSGYRNAPSGLPAEVAHVREVLAHVESDLAIDPERISLMGACSGAALAARLVVADPERYSAVAVLNPSFELSPQMPSRNHFEGHVVFDEWMREQGQVVGVWLAQGGPRTRILHDGGEPGHGELREARMFEAQARTAEFPVMFERIPQTISQHFGGWSELIEWAADQKRNSLNPVEVNHNAGRQNAIMDLLATPFVVVQGTAGTAKQNAELARLAGEFQAAWQRTFFRHCRIVTDEQMEEIDPQHTVLLLGDARFNSLAARLILDGGIEFASDELRMDGRTWRGNHLIVHRAGRAHNGRRYLLVSASDLRDVDFQVPDLSVEGWYRWAVWSRDGGRIRLLEAGR